MSAQAISVSVPRSGSMFRALLWKEWRQQRWVALPLAVLPAVLYVIIFLSVAERFKNDAAVAPTLVLLLTALVAGGSAFCGERDDETEEFLRRMPSGGLRVFFTKLLSVWATICLAALLLGVVASVGSATVTRTVARKVVEGNVNWEGVGSVGAGFLALLLLGLLPALVSAWVRRTLPNILASAALAVGLAGWNAGCVAIVALLTGANRVRGITAFEMLPVGVTLSVLLIGAPLLWNWSRAERSRREKLWLGALMFLLLIIMPASPAIASYLHSTYFAPPVFPRHQLFPSPDGRRVVAEYQYVGWGRYGARLAEVDIDTGRWRWLTKFTKSSMGRGGWSPSGERFGWIAGGAILPLMTRTFEESGATLWVTDATAGTSVRLNALPGAAPELKSDSGRYVHGWLDEETPVLAGGQAILFASLKPEVEWRHVWAPMNVGWIQITRRGAFGIEGIGRGVVGECAALCFWRCTPELPEGEEVTISLEDPALDFSRDTKWISPDGRWAAVYAERVRGEKYPYVMRIEEGATPVRLVPAGTAQRTGEYTAIEGFSANSERLLLHDERHVIAYAPTEGRTQSIDVCHANNPNEHVARAAISPSGRFALSRIERPASPVYYVVTDFESGESREIVMPALGEAQWAGEEWLLLDGQSGDNFLVRRDGTDVRPLITD
jgi:hypothetical protein